MKKLFTLFLLFAASCAVANGAHSRKTNKPAETPLPTWKHKWKDGHQYIQYQRVADMDMYAEEGAEPNNKLVLHPVLKGQVFCVF